MAWAIVQPTGVQTSRTQVTGNSGAGVNVTLPQSPVTGNKILVGFAGNSPAATVGVTSVKDGNGNSLTQCWFAQQSSVAGGLFAYDVPATTSTTLTVVLNSIQTMDISVGAAEIGGLATGNTTAAMLDGTAATNGGVTTPTGTTGYASTASNRFLLSLFCDFGNNANATQPTGFSLLTGCDFQTDPNADLLFAYKNSTNGTESDSWSYTPTLGDIWVIGTVAFKLAAAAAAVPRPIVVNRSYFTG